MFVYVCVCCVVSEKLCVSYIFRELLSAVFIVLDSPLFLANKLIYASSYGNSLSHFAFIVIFNALTYLSNYPLFN